MERAYDNEKDIVAIKKIFHKTHFKGKHKRKTPTKALIYFYI